MRLFYRLLAILLSCAFVPAVALTLRLGRSGSQALENAAALHAQVALVSARQAEAAVAEMNRSLGFVAELERAPAVDTGAALRAMSRAVAAFPRLVSAAVEDARGARFVSIGQGFSAGGDPDAAKARGTGRLALAGVALKGGRPVAKLVHPLSDGRVVVAEYDLSELWRLTGGLTSSAGGGVVLTGTDGSPLPGFRAAPEGKAVSASADVAGVPWRVVSSQPEAEVYRAPRATDRGTLAFALVVLLAAAAAALLLADRLAAPLDALAEGAKRAESSRFDVPVPEQGWAEARALIRSFNGMMRTLEGFQALHVERQLDDKARIEAIIATIPDGILLASLKGEILFINAAAERVLSLEGASPLGRNVDEVFAFPEMRDMLVRVMARSRSEEALELDVSNRAGGKVGTFSCRSAMVERDGNPVGILVFMRDVTLQKELDGLKQSIMETVTHDLRSPLSAISGYAEILAMGLSGPVNDLQKQRLSVIVNSAQVLGRLVNDILDVSKYESGLMRLELSRGRVEMVIETVRSLFALNAEGYKIRFEVVVGRNLPEVDLDGPQIQRVITNLLSNALKFTPEGGAVTITAEEREGGVQVCVRDTGPGIPADKLPKLFTKFFQVEETKLYARTRGTGLGLTVCRMVVESHGGKLWAESEWGKGSSFYFALPAPKAAIS